MNADYRRVKDVFLLACDLEAEARETVLARECGDDADLRAQVEALLAEHDAPVDGDAVTAPTAEPGRAGATVRAGGGRPHPQMIGGCRVVRELGRGGMGVVYLAVKEDERFRRRVAIKVLKRGMDAEEVVRRFDLERQVLAALNHPNIARLYDGGETDDGRPYFTMEYVEGQPFDTYCDSHRLTIAERLDLFRSVCSAVQYAHRNLVVHRDLKPGNVIVTKEGIPKLLDFGIAKIINPEVSLIAGDPTSPEFRVMTPEYASPEQVRGDPITTASDVYSLGVMLYELVSGHRPYRIRSRVKAELERIICEEDPERPSTAISTVEEVAGTAEGGAPTTRTITPESVSRTRGVARLDRLQKRLAGDIDNIVLMAMRKEPQRRYDSVEQFSEDIRRHLNDLPVIARRDSLPYRTGKFLRRHRAGVAVAALVVIAVGAGAIAAIASARAGEAGARAEVAAAEARLQAERAQRRAGQVRELVDFFMTDFHAAVERLPDALEARELIIEKAREYLEENFVEEAEDDPTVRFQLARAYDRLGNIQGGVRNPVKGETPAALASFRRALELADGVAAERPDDMEARRLQAVIRIHLADVRFKIGEADEARDLRVAALEICDELYDPRDAETWRQYAIALAEVAKSHSHAGDYDAAAGRYEESLELRRSLARKRPDDVSAQRSLAVGCVRLAAVLERLDRRDEAIERYADSVDVRRRITALVPDTNRYERDLGLALGYLGQACLHEGNLERADEALAEYAGIMKALALASPTDQRAQRDLATSFQLRGEMLVSRERYDDALALYEEGRGAMKALAEADPTNAQLRFLLATNEKSIGFVQSARGDLDGARAAYERALAIFRALGEADPTNADVRDQIAALRQALSG
ncbi:MAG: protein kinase domain-containing protein [Planctomycetota bacterium]|jgi:serine/threonine protein kinase